MGKIIKIGKDPASDTKIQGFDYKLDADDNYLSRHHAYIDVENPQKMTLTAIGVNKTFLNGSPIINSRPYKLHLDDIIQFVTDQRKPINIKEVLTLAKIPVHTADIPVKKKYTRDFLHLKEVYDTYNENSAKILKQESLINGLRGVVFTLGGASAGFLAFLAKDDGINTQIIKAGIPVVVVLGVTLVLNKLNPREKSNKLLEKFKIDYVCPNQKCSHSFYGSPWELLARPGQCRVCKTSWIEGENKS